MEQIKYQKQTLNIYRNYTAAFTDLIFGDKSKKSFFILSCAQLIVPLYLISCGKAGVRKIDFVYYSI